MTIECPLDPHGPKIPMQAGVLTAAVDVQDDRLEVLVVAWGRREESWTIEHHIIPGVPVSPHVWQQLDEYLRRSWQHESGTRLRLASVCIDTGGHYTKQAYSFVKRKYHRRIYCIKGAKEAGKPLVGRPTKTNLGKIALFPVGTDTAKETIFSRLELDAGEDGFMHFSEACDEEYFKQLCAEKPVIQYRSGRPYRAWVKTRDRNEILDLWVYNLAALEILNPKLDKLVAELEARVQEDDGQKELKASEPEEKTEPADQAAGRKKRQRAKPKRRGGFVNSWKK